MKKRKSRRPCAIVVVASNEIQLGPFSLFNICSATKKCYWLDVADKSTRISMAFTDISDCFNTVYTK